MRMIRYLRVALESIVAHKLRAILTMLGIIIGVAAVLTTMGIGRGAAASITERIESQGTNLQFSEFKISHYPPIKPKGEKRV